MNDLDEYLQRIGFQGEPKVDLETLIKLHRCQAFSIPFENFDVYVNDKVDIDKSAVLDKLIKQGRGGYCYELNGALYDLLTTIGFKVKYLASRPMMGYTELRPKTHMILMVELQGEQYLADVGFTALNIIEPLKIEPGTVHHQYGQCFRIIEDAERGYIFQSKAGDEWESCYSFDLTEQQYIDFKLANFYNSNSTESICTNMIIAGIYSEKGRVRLLNDRFEIKLTDRDEDIQVESEEQLANLLKQFFNIKLDAEKLDKLYARMSSE